MRPTHSESATPLLRDGTGCESPEVRTDSFQTIPLSGILFRHDKVSVFVTTEEDGQISRDYSTYSQRPGGHSTSVAGLARPPGVFRESRSSGQTTHEGDYVLLVRAVGFQSHHVSWIHSLVSTGTQKSLLVDTALNVFRGCMIVPREPTIHFLTDASLKGWGAQWGSHNISGLWSPEEREDHINILELEVVSRALDMWLLRWAGQDVLVELDNSTELPT